MYHGLEDKGPEELIEYLVGWIGVDGVLEVLAKECRSIEQRHRYLDRRFDKTAECIDELANDIKRMLGVS